MAWLRGRASVAAMAINGGLSIHARVAAGGALRAFALEAAVVAAGGLAYFLIRGAVGDRIPEATARALALIDLERTLGLYWERALQDWILPSRALIELANAVYFWLHFPVIVAAAVWLFWRRRPLYAFTRTAFLASAVIGLVMYYLLPVAPPRLFPELGFVDTMARYSQTSYQAQEMGPFVNPFAALPSLHIGWALLLSLALWRARGRRRPSWQVGLWGAAVVLLPAAQFFAVVVTANHYVLDVAAGAAVALAAVLIALGWQRYRAVVLAPLAQQWGGRQRREDLDTQLL